MAKNAHHWFNYRRLSWAVCRYCGLVRLKNEATEKAVRNGCDGLEDPPAKTRVQ